MEKIQTIRIRDEYHDFVKQLRTSTNDFLRDMEPWVEATHYDFIKSCYYDDVKELEKIIFFTSSPFYEFNKAYWYIQNAYEWWIIDRGNSFLSKYEDAKENDLLKIEFKDQKFYFEGKYVPTNPYNEKLINISAFELINEFRKCCQDHPGQYYSTILTDFKEADFIKNHKFDEVYYRCDIDESINKGK